MAPLLPTPRYATNYNVKRIQKHGSNRHLMKHNHDKRSTCCPPKNALLRASQETLTLTSAKIIKIKTNCLLIDGLCFLGI